MSNSNVCCWHKIHTHHFRTYISSSKLHHTPDIIPFYIKIHPKALKGRSFFPRPHSSCHMETNSTDNRGSSEHKEKMSQSEVKALVIAPASLQKSAINKELSARRTLFLIPPNTHTLPILTPQSRRRALGRIPQPINRPLAHPPFHSHQLLRLPQPSPPRRHGAASREAAPSGRDLHHPHIRPRRDAALGQYLAHPVEPEVR